MISCILLAISVSIDALTLGITYGIKHSRINKISNLIVFSIAFVSTSFAIFLGKHISRLFSPSLATFIGSALLILLGIYSIYKSFNKNTEDYDLDHSNSIDKNEAILLALAVSTDASCVGLSCGIIGITGFVYPLFAALFHTIFINYGNIIAYSASKKIKLSDKCLAIFSGFVLILIGLIRL